MNIFFKKNKKGKKQNTQNGYSIIELMLAVFIFSITISGIVFLMIDILESSDKATVLNQATSLAAEGLEAVKSIAIENYKSDLLPLVDFTGKLSFDGTNQVWNLTPDNVETIDSVINPDDPRSFERIIMIDELTADATATSSVKYVRSIVSWDNNQSTTTLETVITNWVR